MSANPLPLIVLAMKGHAIDAQRDNPGAEVIEIDLQAPLYLQLLDIPMDRNIAMNFPQRMSDDHKQKAFERIEAALIIAKISHNTHEKLQIPRFYNCLNNYHRMLNATPLHELKRFEGTSVAVICGNGPSLKDLPNNIGNAAIFSCWHAVSKLLNNKIHPHAVMHCDTRPPYHGFEDAKLPYSTVLIATPSVSPEFLDAYPNNPVYGYYSQEVPAHAWFAAKHRSPDHAAINGTVVIGMIHAALYAGYSKVALVGVDLSSPVEFITEAEPCFQIPDKHGVTVWTSHMYMAYKHAMEQIPRMHKEVKFENWGKTGLVIDGFKDV